MLDVVSENPIALKDVAKLPFVAVGGKRPHVSTICRWRYPGVQGVRLECVRRVGKWITTQSAVLDFFARLSDLNEGNPSAPAIVGPGIDRARAELTAAGIV